MVLRITGDCLNCGVCLDHCARTAIVEKNEQYLIDQETCNECGICRDACPVRAIEED